MKTYKRAGAKTITNWRSRCKALNVPEYKEVIASHPVLSLFDILTDRIGQSDDKVIDDIEAMSGYGMWRDAYGNGFITIGDEPDVLFCAHVDTVAMKEGRVKKRIYKGQRHATGWDSLHMASTGKTILGADDRAGCAILIHMIHNEVPGTYAFFKDEEVGRIGSESFSAGYDLSKWNLAVQWDRHSRNSIITHQSSQRTASKAFCDSLIELFAEQDMLMEADTGGSYTDTYSLKEQIPECTNLSVGYYGQHSEDESQDLTFLMAMADAAVKINWASLPSVRDPKKTEYISSGSRLWAGGNYGHGSHSRGYSGYYGYGGSYDNLEKEISEVTLELMCADPQKLADIISFHGDYFLKNKIRDAASEAEWKEKLNF